MNPYAPHLVPMTLFTAEEMAPLCAAGRPGFDLPTIGRIYGEPMRREVERLIGTGRGAPRGRPVTTPTPDEEPGARLWRHLGTAVFAFGLAVGVIAVWSLAR